MPTTDGYMKKCSKLSLLHAFHTAESTYHQFSTKTGYSAHSVQLKGDISRSTIHIILVVSHTTTDSTSTSA